LRSYAAARGIEVKVSGSGRRLGRAVGLIRKAEQARAKKLSRALTPALLRSVNERFARAQRMRPPKQRILYGFSPLVDQKLSLSPQSVGALLQKGNKARFVQFLKRGPRGGTWGKDGVVDDVDELAAAIYHHETQGGGKAKQFAISSRLGHSLAKSLEKVPYKRDPGGAALFGSNISASFGEVAVSFHSAQVPSPMQARMFSKRVRFVTHKTGPGGLPAAQAADPESSTKINFILEVPKGQRLSFHGRKVVTGDYHRTVLSSQATYHPVFDPRLSNKQLRALARGNDTLVLAGIHYLTGLPKAQAKKEGARLRRQLSVMRAANPNLYVHYSYVVPRSGKLESQLFRQLDGLVDSIDLNSAELGQLSKNIHRRRIQAGKRASSMPAISRQSGPRVNVERPARIYASARALIDATGYERVRIHARWFDLTLVRTDATEAGARTRLSREARASFHARAVTTNKVANPNGRIREAADRWPVVSSMPAEAFREVEKTVNAIARTHGLGNAAKQQLMETGIHVATSPGGVSIALTPAREFYDFSGGLISAGDTLALTALQAVGPRWLKPLATKRADRGAAAE